VRAEATVHLITAFLLPERMLRKRGVAQPLPVRPPRSSSLADVRAQTRAFVDSLDDMTLPMIKKHFKRTHDLIRLPDDKRTRHS
jgi:hypothetical protein